MGLLAQISSPNSRGAFGHSLGFERQEVLGVPEVPHRAAPAGDRPGRRKQVAT